MAQSVRCLPGKHEDLSSDPENAYAQLVEVADCSPGAGEEEERWGQLTGQHGQPVGELWVQ